MGLGVVERIFLFEAPGSTDITKWSLSTKEKLTRLQFEEISQAKVVKPEYVPDPKIAREIQIDAFIELGFHEELKMSAAKYKDSFPEFSDQPENCRGRFNIQLLVEPRIPARRQIELKPGIADFLNGNSIEDNKNIFIPRVPYVIWTNSGYANRDKSEKDMLCSLKEDEEILPLLEGVSLMILHPEILTSHGLCILGTKVENKYFPEFRRMPNKFGNLILQYGTGWADVDFGVPTRSSTIGIRGSSFYPPVRVS